MSSRLSQRGKLITQSFICIVKEKFIKRRISCLLLSIFLFPIFTNAQETLKVGSTTREMIVYAPSGIQPNQPLIISMHGMNQTMTDQKNQTQLISVANANKFVIVFPNAINKQWQLSGTTDIDFILAIIDEMNKRYGIDRDRVYLSGFSMGGMMSYYAATQIADKIAAFAPISGFLMGGPNATSSRPIPIIHIHGQNDNYVPYANVPTHMKAWAIRNGCSTTPEVIKPYPVNKPDSKSVKYYYGTGKEGVEMVFIGVAGVDHYIGEDPNNIFSSQEIWNFCKKFSLKAGVPEFEYASVTDSNTKQIVLSLTRPIVDSGYFKGFTVKSDNLPVNIDSVVLSDSNKLVINLNQNILKDNQITLSYNNGNVISKMGKMLKSFNDTLVDNLLKGASPRIIQVTTNAGGDTMKVKFNMKMKVPSDTSAFVLNASYNGNKNIPIFKPSLLKNDSTVLVYPLGEKVYRDYKLLVTYSGSSIVSADSGLLNSITDLPVANIANGLPVQIISGNLGTDGITLTLEFSKSMDLKVGQYSYFDLYSNSEKLSFIDYSVSGKIIQLTLSKSIHFGDTVILSYSAGNIKAADNGPLDVFSGLAIPNKVNAPVWINIPGKVESENFASKYGMQAETTTDAGGGQNMGYIGNGNWLEYTVENNTTISDYRISFRVAAQGAGGVIDYYVDGVREGSINVPATGNWQVYKSVDTTISITPGKHYLKVVATVSGFNINYMNIYDKLTAVNETSGSQITIYPNPVSNEMIVNSTGFGHNKIEIFDIKGNLLISKPTTLEMVSKIPVHLSEGMYFVKISNDKEFQLKKIVVTNK